MKNLTFTILGLIFLMGVFQAKSQNKFTSLEEHRAFKQKLMNEARTGYNNQILPQNLSKQKNLLAANDYGDAPDLNWAGQFGGSGGDLAKDIVSDAAGNVYFTGSFSGEITVGSNNYTSIGNKDAIVTKFDNSGNLIWLKYFSASTNEEIDAYGICLDESENIYITGYYTGSVTLGTITLPNNAYYNLFFAKLNTSGEVIIAKNHGFLGETQIGLKIDTDDLGNIYILGSTDNNTFWRHPSIILKYDQVGNFIWEQQHDESFNDIMVFNSNIYFAALVGYDNDGNIGNGIILEPKGWGDAFIAKSNLGGDFIWASMGDHANTWDGDSYGTDIIIDENENIYMTGFFRNNVIFGSDTLIVNSGWDDGFIVKCSSDGDFLWANQVDEIANDVSVDNENNSFILYDKYITKFNGDGIEQWTNELNNDPTSFSINSSNKILTTGSIDELIFLSQLNNNANEEWLVLFEGNSAFAWVIGMVTDNSGNVYTYGYASHTLDYFGEEVNKGIFICKQNGEWEIIWLKQFTDVYVNYGYGSYIAIDPTNENIYITGGFNVPLIIPGGPTLTPNEEGSLFIIKYGIDGEYKFAIQEDYNTNYWGGLFLAADNADNIIISSTFQGTINFSGTELISAGSSDVFIAKYNTSGGFLWAIRAGGEDVEYSGLVSVDGNDNIYFTGEFWSVNVTISNAQITMEEGDGNIIFAKLSPDGTVQWVTSKAGSTIPYGDGCCWPSGIKTDAQGYSHIKGWHGDSTYFDNIMLRSPYGFGYSYFIAKFDPDGNTMWANSINEHRWGFDNNQMDIDYQGSVYLGAQITDTIHFGNNFEYINVGEYDLFVAKYLTTGELDWVKIMEGNETSYNWISSVAVYDTSNVFVGGFFGDYLSIDDVELTSANRHGFIIMFGGDILSVKEVYNSNNKEFYIYPNPSNGLVTFTSNFELNNKIEVLNSAGQIVKTVPITSKFQQIDLRNLSKGLYLIKASNDKLFKIKKLIVE